MPDAYSYVGVLYNYVCMHLCPCLHACVCMHVHHVRVYNIRICMHVCYSVAIYVTTVAS